MKTMPLSEAKDKLSGLVDEAESTHEMITITRHGRPAAVLMAADDLESLQETVQWLSQAGLAQSLATAERELVEGETISGDDVRARFGLAQQ